VALARLGGQRERRDGLARAVEVHVDGGSSRASVVVFIIIVVIVVGMSVPVAKLAVIAAVIADVIAGVIAGVIAAVIGMVVRGGVVDPCRRRTPPLVVVVSVCGRLRSRCRRSRAGRPRHGGILTAIRATRERRRVVEQGLVLPRVLDVGDLGDRVDPRRNEPRADLAADQMPALQERAPRADLLRALPGFRHPCGGVLLRREIPLGDCGPSASAVDAVLVIVGMCAVVVVNIKIIAFRIALAIVHHEAVRRDKQRHPLGIVDPLAHTAGRSGRTGTALCVVRGPGAAAYWALGSAAASAFDGAILGCAFAALAASGAAAHTVHGPGTRALKVRIDVAGGIAAGQRHRRRRAGRQPRLGRNLARTLRRHRRRQARLAVAARKVPPEELPRRDPCRFSDQRSGADGRPGRARACGDLENIRHCEYYIYYSKKQKKKTQ
jgi:hypothetical protein